MLASPPRRLKSSVVDQLTGRRSLGAAFVTLGPRDPGIFAGAAVLFGLVAIAAAAVPAYRTTRIDPVAVHGSN
jgi:hypothetical protein